MSAIDASVALVALAVALYLLVALFRAEEI